MKLIKYGRELRDSAKVNSELENQLIVEIEDKIYDKTLDLDYLNVIYKIYLVTLSLAWKIDKWDLIPEGMSRINNIRGGFNLYW